MFVKICGFTNQADAEAAVALGINVLGFIFAESKRQVEVEKAREIIKALPPRVEKIGVFVDEKSETVKRIAAYCGLTGLQFHGNESVEYCRTFADYFVIKAFRIKGEKDLEKIELYLESREVDMILLDTFAEGVQGGTGKTFPWAWAKKLVQRGIKPVVVAGGITPGNISVALRTSQALGIDVCSGVEKRAGKKDIQRMKALSKGIHHIGCKMKN